MSVGAGLAVRGAAKVSKAAENVNNAGAVIKRNNARQLLEK